LKILIRATNWVGDAIMSLPAIRAVRAKFPDAEIAILGRPYVVDLYRQQGIADKLIACDGGGEHAGFSGAEKLAAQLRAEKYDIALLLQNAFGAAWLAWRAGIPERIGYNRDGRSLLLRRQDPAKFLPTKNIITSNCCEERAGSTACQTSSLSR
jgi:heptosyltransferase-2